MIFTSDFIFFFNSIFSIIILTYCWTSRGQHNFWIWKLLILQAVPLEGIREKSNLTILYICLNGQWKLYSNSILTKRSPSRTMGHKVSALMTLNIFPTFPKDFLRLPDCSLLNLVHSLESPPSYWHFRFSKSL